MTDEAPRISWTEAEASRSARWRSERGSPAPRRVVPADDRMTADAAYRLACEGTALLWRGDYHNARQLLTALARRLDRTAEQSAKKKAAGAKEQASATRGSPAMAQRFHQHRQVQAQRARVLSMLLLELDGGYRLDLRRAPDVAEACAQAWGPADGQAQVVSLRELQALIGAYEWRRRGVEIPALAQPPGAYARIHPHYGVFSPVRGEYVDLVAQALSKHMPAALRQQPLAFDIGTGTGVLAAVLARRGVREVVATDMDARALACAQENLRRLGVAAQVRLQPADLFPEGRAALLLCNPPWVPARASAPVERAVYDEDSAMLRGFLAGATAHLLPGGEAWLVLSDLAEHLGLRSREALLDWIAAAGLTVLGRHDIRPRHGKAADASDALHAARAAEVTSLWRLGAAA
ncbi:MAG: methyltransferase [Comamonas sp.]